MKTRTSAYNRDVSRRKALRKRRITQHYWGISEEHPYYDNLHQFSKNKIHCSCPMCSTKTRNKGSRRYHSGNYMKHINYKASELRRQVSMDYDEADYFGGRPHRRKNDW
jgi:hypothetical protein